MLTRSSGTFVSIRFTSLDPEPNLAPLRRPRPERGYRRSRYSLKTAPSPAPLDRRHARSPSVKCRASGHHRSSSHSLEETVLMSDSKPARSHTIQALTLVAAMLSVPAGAISTIAAAEDPNAPAKPGGGPPTYVEVTTTRIPELVDQVPASVTIVTRADLIARGARDMRGALALAVGVDIAPGGDGGPASAVPEIFGLREFDAYLLVVDGVPWGGAFNPAISSVDFMDIERIEVVRGSAPVMYGATSFSGVINVIRREPGTPGIDATASVGSYGSTSASVSYGLPKWGSLASTVSAGYERLGFTDDRTQVDRGHVVWHGAIPQEHGRVRVGMDATWMGQDPASPHPRVGTSLTPAVPLDTNLNPTGSHLNE